jgi:hypothetical protein
MLFSMDENEKNIFAQIAGRNIHNGGYRDKDLGLSIESNHAVYQPGISFTFTENTRQNVTTNRASPCAKSISAFF